MLLLISYDIHDDKRRYHVARLLQAYGARVQYSVFEAHLERSELERLRVKMRSLLDLERDSVRFYNLGERFKQRVEIEGVGQLYLEPENIII
jgi:CRISPR-associated protein Cas2